MTNLEKYDELVARVRCGLACRSMCLHEDGKCVYDNVRRCTPVYDADLDALIAILEKIESVSGRTDFGEEEYEP